MILIESKLFELVTLFLIKALSLTLLEAYNAGGIGQVFS